MGRAQDPAQAPEVGIGVDGQDQVAAEVGDQRAEQGGDRRSSGVALPRTTYTQVYAGQAVYDPANLAAGDLLFVEGSDPGPGGAPGHVGLYIGAGLVVDAPHTGASVQLTRLAGWLPQLVAMRRPVPTLG